MMVTFRKDLYMEDELGLLKVTRGTHVELLGVKGLSPNTILLTVKIGTRTLQRGLYLTQVRNLISVS